MEAQLAWAGLKPGDVDIVVNTCCHFDHIGNNVAFTDTTFFIQRSEFPLAIHAPRRAPY